jgi:hypothetical protein
MKFGFTFDYYLKQASPFDDEQVVKRVKYVSNQTFSDENQQAIMDAFNNRDDDVTIYHKITGNSRDNGTIVKFTIHLEDRVVEEYDTDESHSFARGLTRATLDLKFDLKVFA